MKKVIIFTLLFVINLSAEQLVGFVKHATNVREKPSLDANIISIYFKNKEFKILAEEQADNGYYWYQTPKGYVSKSLVSVSRKIQNNKIGFVKHATNVREKPSKYSKITSMYFKNVKFKILKTKQANNGYYWYETPKGYISKSLVTVLLNMPKKKISNKIKIQKNISNKLNTTIVTKENNTLSNKKLNKIIFKKEKNINDMLLKKNIVNVVKKEKNINKILDKKKKNILNESKKSNTTIVTKINNVLNKKILIQQKLSSKKTFIKKEKYSEWFQSISGVYENFKVNKVNSNGINDPQVLSSIGIGYKIGIEKPLYRYYVNIKFTDGMQALLSTDYINSLSKDSNLFYGLNLGYGKYSIKDTSSNISGILYGAQVGYRYNSFEFAYQRLNGGIKTTLDNVNYEIKALNYFYVDYRF